MFRPGTKPISEVLRGELSKVDFILKNLSLSYTSVIRNRFVWIIFYFGVGFYFCFTVPLLNLCKSCKFSNVTNKVKSNIMTEHYSKRKSNIFQELPLTKRIATKHKPLLISAT